MKKLLCGRTQSGRVRGEPRLHLVTEKEPHADDETFRLCAVREGPPASVRGQPPAAAGSESCALRGGHPAQRAAGAHHCLGTESGRVLPGGRVSPACRHSADPVPSPGLLRPRGRAGGARGPRRNPGAEPQAERRPARRAHHGLLRCHRLHGQRELGQRPHCAVPRQERRMGGGHPALRSGHGSAGPPPAGKRGDQLGQSQGHRPRGAVRAAR